jgi:hypothetical protein
MDLKTQFIKKKEGTKRVTMGVTSKERSRFQERP